MEESSPRRRLPTKTRSGIISLPPAIGDDSSELSHPRQLSPLMSPFLQQVNSSSALEVTRSSISRATEEVSVRPSSPSSSLSDRLLDIPAPRTSPSSSSEVCSTATSPRSEAVSEGSPLGATFKYGPPKQAPKPAPLPSGPLNATSTPQTQSLPVQRRGSYAALKRQSSHEGEEPSVMGMLKKATHWEHFGTIMTLVCLSTETSDGQGVLQMLQAEGYDTNTMDSPTEALDAFRSSEVFPDAVIIDADLPAFGAAEKLIKQLQLQNATVTIVVLASKGNRLDVVSALQAGAADYMIKPLDLDELVARIERHVQRQHSIKLALDQAMEEAKAMMLRLERAKHDGNKSLLLSRSGSTGALLAVAETEFEQQITDLSDENHRLGVKIQELEKMIRRKDRTSFELERKLGLMELRLDDEVCEAREQLSSAVSQNSALMNKVDELERLVRSSNNTSVVNSSSSNRNSSSIGVQEALRLARNHAEAEELY